MKLFVLHFKSFTGVTVFIFVYNSTIQLCTENYIKMIKFKLNRNDCCVILQTFLGEAAKKVF